MTTQEIKNEIHKLVEDSSTDRLEYVYSILQTTEYSEEFKSMLDDDFADYQQNPVGDTREKISAMINNIITEK